MFEHEEHMCSDCKAYTIIEDTCNGVYVCNECGLISQTRKHLCSRSYLSRTRP